jgi:hypothetical protein
MLRKLLIMLIFGLSVKSTCVSAQPSTFAALLDTVNIARGQLDGELKLPPLTNGLGTPSSPKLVSFDSPNTLMSDKFHNNFHFQGQAGDELFIRVSTANPVGDQWFARCAGGGQGAYYEGIVLRESTYSCTYDLKTIIQETKVYSLFFEYPDANYGSFEARLVRGNPAVTSFNGKGGYPGNPAQLSASSGSERHEISSNPLINYYALEALSGQTLVLQAYEDQNIYHRYPTRCVAEGGKATSNNSFGFSVDGGETYSCSLDLEHTVESSGLLNLHVRLPYGIGGYFLAAVLD